MFTLGSPARAIVEGDDVDSYENESSEFSMLPCDIVRCRTFIFTPDFHLGFYFTQIYGQTDENTWGEYCKLNYNVDITTNTSFQSHAIPT